ncbi:hypothetical protein D3C71_689380 [compost metagenome]
MKTTILLLLLITFSASGQNETAFTLAKKLAKFDYKINPTIADRELSSELLGSLVYYTRRDDYDKYTDSTLVKYPVLYNRYLSVKNAYFFCDSLVLAKLIFSKKVENFESKGTIKNISSIDTSKVRALINYFKKFRDIQDEIEKDNKDITQIEQYSTTLNSKPSAAKILKSEINNNRIKNSPEIFVEDSSTAEAIRKRIIELENIIPLEIQEYKKNQSDLILKIDSEIRALSNETRSSIFDKGYLPKPEHFDYESINKSIKNSRSEITPVELKVNGSPTGSISFKMPSESEMIEAAAAYLAKRVKQESVLWFFDEIRENAEVYDLLSTAFPETMKLLQSEEIYRTPNLSVTWRSAMSKDFVKMPKNVFDSDWLKKQLPDEQHKLAHSYLSTGWEIAQYVDQKFSYREIIRQLYLNKRDTLIDTAKISPNTLIEILYAFSTELYTLKQNNGWEMITYEDLRNLTAEEMYIMLALLDMRYNQSIQTICGSKLFDRKKPMLRDNADKISAWLGRFTFALNQFDKVLQEISQEKEKSIKDPNYKFSYYNVWNLMSQALMELLPKEAITSEKSQFYHESQFYIGLLNDSYEIYDMISNQNYARSVSKIMNLVDKLLYKDSVKYTYTSETKLVFLKGEFREKDKDKYEVSKTALASHLAKLGIKPRKIHRVLIKNDKDFISFDKSPTNLPIGDTCAVSLDIIKQNTTGLKCAINRLKKNKNLTPAIKELIDNPKYWGGSKYVLNRDSMVLSFPINSIGAMVLTSQYQKSLQMIRKLSSFLNDVALAKDEEMLVKVVESYALPPGSYKQKRNSWFSVDLNAFVGAYAGYEALPKSQLKSLPDSIRSSGLKGGFVYGISAPIGVSFTKTFGKRLFGTSEITTSQRNNPDLVKVGKSKIKSLSGFSFTTTITILDLGAIVSYRFTNTDSVAQQSFKWSQFVSPGLHFAISIRNTPLVIMTGIQYTPQLRRVKPITESPLNMTRLYAGIYFDLPLYNMYTKRRVYKL